MSAESGDEAREKVKVAFVGPEKLAPAAVALGLDEEEAAVFGPELGVEQRIGFAQGDEGDGDEEYMGSYY